MNYHKINLPHTSLDYQQICTHDPVIMYIELCKSYLHYKVSFTAEEPENADDLMMGTREVTNYIEITALRSKCVAVELSLVEGPESKKQVWRVMISISGKSEDIRMFFYEKEKAREVYNEISDWII